MALQRRVAAWLVSLARSLSTPVDNPLEAAESFEAPAPARDVVAPDRAPASEPPRADPERSREAAIKALLETCALAFAPDGRPVRANVMTFTPDRSRRVVQRATAFNMDGDPDAGLEIDATAGASGKAVLYRRAAVADLTLLRITDVPPWGLRADEQAQVRRHLRSILSAPIFDPRSPDGPLLGTLQIDSDLTVEDMGFSRPEAAELMQQFADVLSLLMIGINVRFGHSEDVAAAPRMSHSRVQNATQVEPGMYVANSSTSIFLMSMPREPFP